MEENEKPAAKIAHAKRVIHFTLNEHTITKGIEIAKDALTMRTGLASGQNEKYKFDVDITLNGWVLVTVTKTEPDEAWGKWRTLALSPTALVELAITTGLINADLNVEDPLHIVAVAGD